MFAYDFVVNLVTLCQIQKESQNLMKKKRERKKGNSEDTSGKLQHVKTVQRNIKRGKTIPQNLENNRFRSKSTNFGISKFSFEFWKNCQFGNATLKCNTLNLAFSVK